MKTAVLLLAIVAPLAHADEAQFLFRRGAPAVIECESLSALAGFQAALSNARAHADDASVGEVERLRAKGDCVEGPVASSPVYLEATHSEPVAGVTYRVAEVSSSKGGVPGFVLESDIVPVNDRDSSPHHCIPSASGEVDRLEAGRGGEVYLRRYWMSSTCVNGVMQADMRPIK